MTETLVGQVIFKSSRHVTVNLDGVELRCELRGVLRRRTGNPIVVGDRVEVIDLKDGTGRVESVLERRSLLSRRRKVAGRELVLAANVDQVLAVFAYRRPRLKYGALDRLLIAAESQGLRATIVVNKMDLADDPQERAEVESRFREYEALGYPVCFVSAETGEGLETFEARTRGVASVVSGPSGVGKSALLSRLFPDREIRVGEVSEHNEKGRHTTTAATWYPIPGGGAVVDTPGFRDYALWGLRPGDVDDLMPDIRAHAASCRFRDCLHLEEPDCAVRTAAEEGELPAERYRSYQGIVASIE